MSVPFAMTVLSAVAVFITCGCVALHEILVSPDRPNYPTAPMRQRAVMFCWMVALGYRGVEILQLLLAPDPVFATPGQLAGSIMVAAVHGVMLEQHMRRWLPVRLQARIRRLWEIASCRKAKDIAAARAQSNRGLRPGIPGGPTNPDLVPAALTALVLDGAQAIAPGETPLEWSEPHQWSEPHG